MPSLERAFKDPAINPVILEAALLATFGTDWLAWDGDSLTVAIERDSNIKIGSGVKNKLNALLVLHANNAYWEDWRAFEGVSWALSGLPVDWIQMNPLTPVPLIYGLRVAHTIDKNPKFSDEVKKYISSVFLHEQYSLLPIDLAEMQSVLFGVRPDLKDRADLVYAGLEKGSTASTDPDTSDAAQVELGRHRILMAVLDAVSSKEIIMLQARRYGLDDMVRRLLRIN